MSGTRQAPMPPRLTFEYNPLSYAYPDDETAKELFVQAAAPAVFLYWANVVFNDGEEVWQVVRLDQRDTGPAYVYPDLIVVDGCDERERHATFSLGVFSRDQREVILDCADEIEYDRRSGEEGQCMRWMDQLLDRLISEGLLTPEVVDALHGAVSSS